MYARLTLASLPPARRTGLRAFVAEHRLGVVVHKTDLAAIVEFREALRAACRSHIGVPVPPAAVAALGSALSRTPMTLSIDARGTAWRGSRARAQRGRRREIASGIATAIGEGTWPRLKGCTSDVCRWVY